MRARTPKDIGLLLREQRRSLGLDQLELARRAGVSRQWIIEVEKGKPRAAVGLMLRALAALDLTLDIRAGDVVAARGSHSPEIDLDAVIERAREPSQYDPASTAGQPKARPSLASSKAAPPRKPGRRKARRR